MLSTIHQETPQTTTQPMVVSVHHDDNHEPVQPFYEVLVLYNNHVDLQPQVTMYLERMDLHQLQHLLVFKTNHHTPIFIWYPLIQKWNDFTYSTCWSNFVTLTKNCLINHFYTTFRTC
jgi:hypothetical protein